MAKGSLRVRPGQRVAAGEPLGRVGLSGATAFPHLHLTVRHRDKVIDPFAFGAAGDTCGGGTQLWHSSLRAVMAYRPRSVLNVGFSNTAVTMEQIETGEPLWRDNDPDVMVVFVRSIGLKAGDLQHLEIRAPDGNILADHSAKQLDRNQAQSMLYLGRKKPIQGWPTGAYQAVYTVSVDGQVVLERRFSISR